MERQFFPATDACILALDIVWTALTELGLTGGRSKPLVSTFTGPIDCPALGMYRPEVATVYANADDAEKLDERLVYIIVEQVIHHVSGDSGYRREFQAMQTQIIGRLVQNACNAFQKAN